MLDSRPLQVTLVSDTSIWASLAASYLRGRSLEVDHVSWDHGVGLPPVVDPCAPRDLILSFKSDLLLDDSVLASAKLAAINFHPATPQYRGIGGYFYVLNDQCSTYGVTCHFMTIDIDAGPIIRVDRFPIYSGEQELSVRERAGAAALEQFYWVVDCLLEGRALPLSSEIWGTKLYTRRQLQVVRERQDSSGL